MNLLIPSIMAVFLVGIVAPAYADIVPGVITDTDNFILPYDIAIDSQNRVIASDGFYRNIMIYDIEGKLLDKIEDDFKGGISIAIDSDDNIITADNMADKIKIYDARGEHKLTITEHLKNPSSVAVDSQDRIIVINRAYEFSTFESFVSIFESDGTFVKSFSGADTPSESLGVIAGIAAYPGTDDIIITDSTSREVLIFDSNGKYLSSITEGFNPEIKFDNLRGVAASNGVIFFVSDDSFIAFQHDGTKFSFMFIAEGTGYAGLSDIDVNDKYLVLTDALGNKIHTATDPDCTGYFASQLERKNLSCRNDILKPIKGTVNYINSTYFDANPINMDINRQNWMHSIAVIGDISGKYFLSIFEGKTGKITAGPIQLDYKPRDVAHNLDMVYVTDPEGKRVLVYNNMGKLVYERIFLDEDKNTISPGSIAIDKRLRYVILDESTNKVYVYDFKRDLITTISGYLDTVFEDPTRVVVSYSNQEIYVIDEGKNLVIMFNFDGTFAARMFSGVLNGDYDSVATMAKSSDRNFYIADNANKRIQILDSTGVHLDSLSYTANFEPADMVIKGDNVYLADAAADRIFIFSYKR